MSMQTLSFGRMMDLLLLLAVLWAPSLAHSKEPVFYMWIPFRLEKCQTKYSIRALTVLPSSLTGDLGDVTSPPKCLAVVLVRKIKGGHI